MKTLRMAEIMLIDGPTRSGKTQYIKNLGAMPSNTLTSEALIDILLQIAKGGASLDKTAAKLSHIEFIEDLDLLCGRETTQKLAAQLIQRMAQERRIILTGINFQERLPYFMNMLSHVDTMVINN